MHDFGRQNLLLKLTCTQLKLPECKESKTPDPNYSFTVMFKGHLDEIGTSKDEIDLILSRMAWFGKPRESIESMRICSHHHAVLVVLGAGFRRRFQVVENPETHSQKVIEVYGRSRKIYYAI